MFTGIIEGIGTVEGVVRHGDTASFEMSVDFDLGDVNVGDSISVDGCCLTVTSRLGSHFWADASGETLRVTTLGRLKEGEKTNIERALKIGGRMGGHIVSGHIDGVGKVALLKEMSEGKEIEVQVPPKLSRYIVQKGAITIDGVSLTVNGVSGDMISVCIIPYTAGRTTFKYRKIGDPVNIEVDIIGKYVEKMRSGGSGEGHEDGEITEDFLKKHGF